MKRTDANTLQDDSRMPAISGEHLVHHRGLRGIMSGPRLKGEIWCGHSKADNEGPDFPGLCL